MAALPSTRTAPIRRSIYLIVMDGGNDIHTLHRIDTSPLFAAGAGRAQHGAPEATQRFAAGGRAQHGPEATATQPAATLPQPLARFDCARGRQFLPLGRGVEKIVSVDRNRHTVIFDTRTESVRAGPDARHVKWHGFTDGGASDLCAADVNTAGRTVRRHVWAYVDGYANPAGVWLKRSYLSYLGGGRFCVTRFIRETDKDGRSIMTAVVTAVEATRAAASASRERPLRMVSRGSVRYHGPVCDSPGWAQWAY